MGPHRDGDRAATVTMRTLSLSGCRTRDEVEARLAEFFDATDRGMTLCAASSALLRAALDDAPDRFEAIVATITTWEGERRGRVAIAMQAARDILDGVL